MTKNKESNIGSKMIKHGKERNIILLVFSITLFSLLFHPVVQDYGIYLLHVQWNESLQNTGYVLNYELDFGNILSRVLALSGFSIILSPMFLIENLLSGELIEPGFFIFLAILPWTAVLVMIRLMKNIKDVSKKRKFFYIWIVLSQLSLSPVVGIFRM